MKIHMWHVYISVRHQGACRRLRAGPHDHAVRQGNYYYYYYYYYFQCNVTINITMNSNSNGNSDSNSPR